MKRLWFNNIKKLEKKTNMKRKQFLFTQNTQKLVQLIKKRKNSNLKQIVEAYVSVYSSCFIFDH